jgi:hypothetical protein
VNALRESATEAQLQKYVEDLLRVYGWTWHHAGDSRRSTPGLPDIVAVRAPRVIFAELKKAKGKLRPEQWDWMSELGNCPGVESYIWRPSDLNGIAELLK